MSHNQDREVIRVLVVGMVDSPHLARWLTQFQDQPLQFLVFPSSPNRSVHEKILGLVGNEGQRAVFNVARFATTFSFLIWLFDLVLRGMLRKCVLNSYLRNFKPHIVHGVELQHAGYLILKRFRSSSKRPVIYLTNWGSDVFWYSKKTSHARRLSELFQICDFYSAECTRDVGLARELGFRGVSFPVVPNAGGLDLEKTGEIFRQMETSQRRMVLIKGYTNFVGRAQHILVRLPRIAEELEQFEVVVFSATLHARLYVRYLKASRKIRNIRVYKKKSLSHDQMLQLFGNSKLYLGFSLSDGISTSMLEAMATGCYPLQTSTACIDEWVNFGSSIEALEVGSPDDAIESLVRWLRSSDVIDRLAAQNRKVVEARADATKISVTVSSFYKHAKAL